MIRAFTICATLIAASACGGPAVEDAVRDELFETLPVPAACGNLDRRCDYSQAYPTTSLYLYACDVALHPLGRDAWRCVAFADDCAEAEACADGIAAIGGVAQ